MIFASSHVLGIAVTDRAIAVAEISGKGSDRMVRRAATFALPAELSFDESKTLGQVLGRFLKEKGFSASRAMVGVPAKWLIAVEKEVPPAGREQIKAMLRLQAERLPLAESGDVVFEYAGQHPTGAPGKVLLLAMLQKQLDKVMMVMDEAGLTVVAVTATSLALANAAVEAAKLDHTQPMVLLGRHGAEVVWQRGGTPRMLKHFTVATTNGHGTPALGPLGMELRRAVAVGSGGLPASGQPSTSAAELVLWDAVGLEDVQVDELSERVGVKVRAGDGLAMLGVKTLVRSSPSSGDEASPQRYPAPVALAIVGASPSLIPFDFVKSRLAPPKVRRFGRKTVWSAAAVALVVIAIGWLVAEVQIEQRTLDELKAQRNAIAAQFKEADAARSRVDFSNRYYKERTPVMDALLEITRSFPVEGIWATNVTLKEDREGRDLDRLDGTMEGKTTDNRVPWVIVDYLRGHPKFTNVTAPTVNPITSGGRGQRESLFSYTIIFTFNASTPPTTAPSTR